MRQFRRNPAATCCRFAHGSSWPGRSTGVLGHLREAIKTITSFHHLCYGLDLVTSPFDGRSGTVVAQLRMHQGLVASPKHLIWRKPEFLPSRPSRKGTGQSRLRVSASPRAVTSFRDPFL